MIFALVLIFFACQVQAEDMSRNRYSLFNECAPIDVVVEEPSDKGIALGLTEGRILTIVKNRLQAQNIRLDKDAEIYLYARIGVSEIAFSATTSFYKRLSDPITDLKGSATAWGSSSYGTHGEDADFIVETLLRHVDRFVDEYQQANRSACGNQTIVRKASPPVKKRSPTKVRAPLKSGNAGRGFRYSNVSFADTKNLLTGETGKGYMGEMTNNSGKNYIIVNFTVTIYGRGGTMLGVVATRITDFADGETKSFVTLPLPNSENLSEDKIQSYKIAYEGSWEDKE